QSAAQTPRRWWSSSRRLPPRRTVTNLGSRTLGRIITPPSEGRLGEVRSAVRDRGVGLEGDVEDMPGVLGRQDRRLVAEQAADEMTCAGTDRPEIVLRHVGPRPAVGVVGRVAGIRRR